MRWDNAALDTYTAIYTVKLAASYLEPRLAGGEINTEHRAHS